MAIFFFKSALVDILETAALWCSKAYDYVASTRHTIACTVSGEDQVEKFTVQKFQHAKFPGIQGFCEHTVMWS